eukprot:TRINITY_DN6043_c0_g1_i5.p1 TRINITY_DN6043_c0_g1~~TRINITY_DN6043_c0_g1_i5.p1  ORF type:complete len:357 (+),score=117.93 TRINITY_DN6043_c0_g1_i5:114-1184(+)
MIGSLHSTGTRLILRSCLSMLCLLPTGTGNTVFFGDLEDKMTAELQGSDHILRKKVLIEINEDFHRADFVVASLKSGLLEELIKCCKEDDDARRELASSAVMKVAGTEEGREHLASKHHLADLSVLLRDTVPAIRENTYRAFLFVAEYRKGYDAVVSFGLLPTLVDLLEEEKMERIIALDLSLIRQLSEAEAASDILLDTPVLERVNKHLQSEDIEVRKKATANISALSFKLIGKKKIILAESIPILCKLLEENDQDLLVHVTKALASLANKKHAKMQIMENGAFKRIKELLKHENPKIRLNIIQLIANSAELPKIKEEVAETLDELRSILENGDKNSEIIKRFAQTAINVITWKP